MDQNLRIKSEIAMGVPCFCAQKQVDISEIYLTISSYTCNKDIFMQPNFLQLYKAKGSVPIDTRLDNFIN